MDTGRHVVCARVTAEWLQVRTFLPTGNASACAALLCLHALNTSVRPVEQFSASRGNDLMTPRPEFSFPGLKPGDKWCLWSHLRTTPRPPRPSHSSALLRHGGPPQRVAVEGGVRRRQGAAGRAGGDARQGARVRHHARAAARARPRAQRVSLAGRAPRLARRARWESCVRVRRCAVAE